MGNPEGGATLEDLFRSKLAKPEKIAESEIRSKVAGLEATYGEDGARARLQGIGGPYDWPSRVENAAKRWKPDPVDLAKQHARTLAQWVDVGHYQSVDALETIREEYPSDRLHDVAVEEFWAQVRKAA